MTLWNVLPVSPMNIYTRVLYKTHTSGSGKTLKSIQESDPDGTSPRRSNTTESSDLYV